MRAARRVAARARRGGVARGSSEGRRASHGGSRCRDTETGHARGAPPVRAAAPVAIEVTGRTLEGRLYRHATTRRRYSCSSTVADGSSAISTASTRSAGRSPGQDFMSCPRPIGSHRRTVPRVARRRGRRRPVGGCAARPTRRRRTPQRRWRERGSEPRGIGLGSARRRPEGRPAGPALPGRR